MSESLKDVKTIPTDGRTFFEIQRELQASVLDDGEAVICPCCDQHAMVCKRKITDTMARQLKRIAERGTMEAKEIQQGVNGRERMYSLLRFWGLLAAGEKHQWSATALGREFVDGGTCVPKYVYIYNNEAVSNSEELVTFEECLDAPFDLPEVFSTTAKDLSDALPVSS
jgi:hypothetical protein